MWNYLPYVLQWSLGCILLFEPTVFRTLCYCAVPYGLGYGIALTMGLMTMGREAGRKAGFIVLVSYGQGIILVLSGNALAQVVRVW